MVHGWASDVALSNIHERYLFRSLFHFILEHTSKYGFTIRMHLSPTSKLGYLSFNDDGKLTPKGRGGGRSLTSLEAYKLVTIQ